MTRIAVVSVLLVSLVAAAGFAQENPHAGPQDLPLAIETLPPEPTVVKTGDLITEVYRVRFRDLIDQGKEIIVLEDRVAPENLPVAPFEGVGLEVLKRQVGDEHIWDFVYKFRIINPVKASYILPSFSVYWLIRDVGQEIEESEVLQYETDPQLVRYVSTITEQAVLDVRDTIQLGDFTAPATFFRTVAWVVAPLPLLFWGIMLVRVARRPRPVLSVKQKLADELDQLEAQMPDEPRRSRARRNLRRQLRALGAMASGDNGRVPLEVERDLVISFREYLRAELPELNPGDTPKDIQRYIETRLGNSGRKDALMDLARRLVMYQSGLERGVPTSVADPAEEVRAIEASLARLQPHVRAYERVKGLLGQD
jgi:hypothetical protein